MENITQIYNNLGTFFGNNISLENIMNIIRNKFEQYMMNTFNVLDWHCDEDWLINFSKGILNKKPKDITIEWINDQIANEARREIMED